MNILRFLFLITALILLHPPALSADVIFDVTTAKIVLNQKGRITSISHSDGSTSPAAGESSFRLNLTNGEKLIPNSLTREGNELKVSYTGDWSMTFQIKENNGFILFELTDFHLPENIAELDLFNVALPKGTGVASILNAGITETTSLALMAAEPNIHAFSRSPRSFQAKRKGCSHQFAQDKQAAKLGNFGARFTATSDENNGGWVMQGRYNPAPINLSGFKALKVWVHGDGKGQLLKIQLLDKTGGNRDDYIKIDFEGWKPFTFSKADGDTLDYANITTLNLYYNALPTEQTVSCNIDQIEALIEKNGKEEILLIEDFEKPDLPRWTSSHQSLNLKTYARYGLKPLRFALLAVPKGDLLATIDHFETAAGLPNPKYENHSLKESPLIKQSYFFITRFKPEQFDETVKIARQGGFKTILFEQSSWCRGTGHYATNLDDYPGGLPDLVKMVQRFKTAGFRVGFHVLAASLYPPDKYITPVPDHRLVKDASIALASNIDAKADFIPTLSPPVNFPATNTGYTGNGTDLHLGDELIRYTSLSLTPPYGFKDCQRGYLGTKAANHSKNNTIHHLQRSFGYLMHDMDSTLLDEVAANFAKVANACELDMVYFDGSERLQGDIWYYNARLISTFYNKLKNKNTLMQASSVSHYSWHLLSRWASADGHDDLKAYLDERSSSFGSSSLYRIGMPLDVGWYYGYDSRTTPDMFEYILGATIGYDSSFSFQVSVDASKKNPFTRDYLSLISRFEKLRLSGRVDEAMKQRLHINPILGGLKADKERAKLLSRRREYRLLGDEGKESFQRVMYDPWLKIDKLDDKANQWITQVEKDNSKIGVQFHALPGEWLKPGNSWYSDKAILLESFDNLTSFLRQPKGKTQTEVIKNGESGTASDEVTQSLLLLSDKAPEGKNYAVYEAKNPKPTPGGWSMMHRSFSKAIDLSQHKGIGLWMRGDGKGGKFKLQLHDAKTALDFYISNGYIGWRYQQLPWPKNLKIDLAQIRSFELYYNGIPANTTIACGIDGIKALPAIDLPSIINPTVKVGDRSIEWKGELKQGEYLVIWPGEAIKHYQLDQNKTVTTSTIAPLLRLPKGPHEVQFSCQGALTTSLRARISRQPAEKHPVPAE